MPGFEPESCTRLGPLKDALPTELQRRGENGQWCVSRKIITNAAAYKVDELVVKHFQAQEGLDAVGPVQAVGAVRANRSILFPIQNEV